MKTNIIKWDEGMAARCLERIGNTAVRTVADKVEDVGGSTYDKQWAEFEKALSKALNK